MNTSALWLGGVVLLLGGVVTTAGSVVSGFDYFSVPPQPADLRQAVGDRADVLATAIATAEREVGRGSIAVSARLVLDGSRPEVEVIVYGETEAHRVRVDLGGSVVSTTLHPLLPGDPVGDAKLRKQDGIRYYDLREGNGASPGDDALVRITCTGWLLSHRKVPHLDYPGRVKLKQLDPGLRQGIATMKVGGRRKLIIPPELAAGLEGDECVVPPNATLIVDVELLRIIQ